MEATSATIAGMISAAPMPSSTDQPSITVIPAGSPVLRIFRVIGLGRFLPGFASLEQALPAEPAAAD